MHPLLKKILIFIPFLVLLACSSAKDFDELTVDQLYEEGVRLYNEKDYVEAAKAFNIITVQYPASQYADKAQFHLAEINFAQGEYIMAVFNYNLLRRAYPASTYYKQAYFNSAMSMYKMSPTFDRDQDYTKKALKAFQEFQYLYPQDSLYKEADKYIDELRNKLARREIYVAEMYRKMESPKASIVYYDSVINDYNDTKYFEDAMLGKVEALFESRRYDEAIAQADAYEKRFPNGKYRTNISDYRNRIGALRTASQ